MIATIPFVQNTFDHFNRLCFESALPPVPIVLTKARTFLGKMEYRVKRSLFGKVVSHDNFRMKISTSFDLPQDQLEDVIIHEMIHYYIAIRNIKDTSAHGTVFRRMMDTINSRYGRNIQIRFRCKSVEQRSQSADMSFRKHYICVSTLRDGTLGITDCASTRVFEIIKLLPRYYQVEKIELYGSIDPFFNRYPRSNTPKIYLISADELSEHLKDAVRLK